MIKYKLICKNCDITFDSWFASSKEYEKLKKKNFLACYNCDSSKVEKTLMAPQLISNQKKPKKTLDSAKYQNIKRTIKDYQKFIKDNFEYVGKNFSYEARSVHYEKRKKNIYGNASKQELKDLKDEGIYTQIIPWIEDTDN